MDTTNLTGPTTWTIAIRPNAQRGIFHRVAGIALTWHHASDLGTWIARQWPEAAVWTVPTVAAEQDAAKVSRAHAEDVGNVLVGTGRRIRIAEDGVLPFATRPSADGLRYSEKSALRQAFEYGNVYYTTIVRPYTVKALLRRGLIVRNPAVPAEQAYQPHSVKGVQATAEGVAVLASLMESGAIAEYVNYLHEHHAAEVRGDLRFHERPMFEVVGEMTAERALSL